MFVVRCVTKEDIDAILSFSKTASLGIANLPTHMPRLEKMISDGIASFQKKVQKPGPEIYPFILEDTSTKEKIGTASLTASAGTRTHFCTYYLENIPEGESEPLEGCNHTLLYPRNYEEGPSEMIALYLSPLYRKGGLGKLLSFSRLLYVASFRERFTESLFADIRGYSTPDQRCPFWDSIGGKITKWSYQEVLQKLDREEVYLSSLVTRYPIHWCLLTPEAQKYAGKTHPNTQAAYYMLNHQGFGFQKEISALDGGPTIISPVDSIKCIAASVQGKIANIVDSLEVQGIEVFLCNESPFRVCQTNILANEGAVTINTDVAKALQLDVGSIIRYTPLHHSAV